jgi:hypothetical protein
MMADAAGAPADQGLIAVPEEGPLNGLAARVLNEGNPIKVTPKIAVSLGLVPKAETVYVAYDKNVKDGNALEDIRVSQQRGKTDIVLGAMDPATKTLTLYLTSPSGVLEKAVASGKNDYAEVPLDQAQAGFQKAVDFWTKTLPPLKTGSFEATFTTRSPLSEMKALTQRLAYSGDTTDYDLGSETFLVYVPEKYNPKKPMGLLVLANYKPTDSLPDPVLPQLADANMAMIVAKDYPQDQWWQRAGFALDAAYNMEQQYKIDPRRVYVFGGGDWHPDGQIQPLVSERVGLNYPEVFSGTFTVGLYGYDKVEDGRGGFWLPEMPRPMSRSLALAKQRPLVAGENQPSDVDARFAAAMTEDGFRHLKMITVTTDQFHYPNYTTDWLPDVLKFMDATTADLDLSQAGDDAASTGAEP